MKSHRIGKAQALLLAVAFLTTTTFATALGPTNFSLSRSLTGSYAGRNDKLKFVEQPGVERATSVEGITEYRLKNGLRVLLFPDQTKQTITVNITYLVGSRNENYGETGMAHLLEHLVFKGTPRHSNIPQELTAHGASPNGTTSLDRTNYFETFAATDENLNWALDLEADRMVNSFIAKKDLDSEMTVVRNELESGENFPFSVLLKRMMSVAFDWHNYGNSTIGARADIENVPIERLQAFYKTYYQPDNAVLLVAGKFDEAKTLAPIHKYFSAIPKPTRQLPRFYTQEPMQDGERAVTLRRVGDTQLISALYHVPPGSHADYAAVSILGLVLSDAPSGRLHKALVETKKATSIFGFNYQMRDPGVAIFGAEVLKNASLDPVRDILLETIDKLTASPPTKEEVERARITLLKNIELNLNNSQRIGLELSEWVAMGDWRLYFLNRDRLRKVTVEGVAQAASKYLKPSNRTLGVFVPTQKPDRAEIPQVQPSDVADMLKDYKSDSVVAAGEAFDPSSANIEARTSRNSLPSGLEMALLPKQTRGDTVVAAMTLRFGDEKSLVNRSVAGQFAGQMLMRGTTKHTRQQLRDEFDRLKARVGVGGSATQANISIETLRENLPAVMRLVAEVLREPAFPTDEFEQLKQQWLAEIEQQGSEPGAIASTLFNRHIGPFPKGDVRYTSTPEEQIEEIKTTTLEAVKRFYRDFYGASNTQLAVVGDFDDKEIARLAAELFSNWKSPRPFVRVVSVYREVPVINKSIEAPDKANAFFIAGLNFKARDDNPDYPALILGNYVLGGGFLNSRLATRIRQKEGLSYGVGSSVFVSSLDEFGTFRTSAIYAPQNVDKLEAAFKEEIARMLKDGFTGEEIEAAKSGYLQSRQVNRAQDASLANALASYLFLDRTFAWDASFEKKIAALTPEQVTSAMRRHIDPTKIMIIKAGDFAKTNKAASGSKQ
jgi:zinc protease